MATGKEVEIKFLVDDIDALTRKLRASGFRLKTRRTHELNTLYDTADGTLKQRGELLRIRKYGEQWVLTHKAKGKNADEGARHKSRIETQTEIADGKKLDAIVRALGFAPSFAYEKFRAEWSDGTGDVVIDETPIGNVAEIEGPVRWIDRTAKALGVGREQYSTKNYATLFAEWKQRTGSNAQNMTFREVGRRKPISGSRSAVRRSSRKK
jgi:adenylate cyclase class 2